jgi:hemerythrin superfamily protein
MTTTTSLISKLLEDHRKVERLFAEFDSKGESSWKELFCELTNDLVRHEVAEEEIVYPELRKAVPDGDAIADKRIEEQAEAEELLDKMEKMSTTDAEFAASLARLREAVLQHAESEEQTVFPPLAQSLDSERQAKLGERYEKAKGSAPTHPHPHAPDTPPGNLVLGPVAAMVDRFRDAMRKAS